MKHVIFSDLDGTLLDHDTYSYTGALEGLNLIRVRGAVLVLVSSKTRDEMAAIHRELALDSPFVFENGGGIYWPENRGRTEYVGKDAEELRGKRAILETVVGGPVRFIDEMDLDEVIRLTGLSPGRAMLARTRHASLPFVSDLPVDVERVNTKLGAREAAITRGGRFHHLISIHADKGRAVKKIIDYYLAMSGEPLRTIGIGDSENDIAMLGSVDLPFIVRKQDGSAIETGIGGVRTTEEIGPRGFSEAVRSVLEKI